MWAAFATIVVTMVLVDLFTFGGGRPNRVPLTKAGLVGRLLASLKHTAKRTVVVEKLSPTGHRRGFPAGPRNGRSEGFRTTGHLSPPSMHMYGTDGLQLLSLKVRRSQNESD